MASEVNPTLKVAETNEDHGLDDPVGTNGLASAGNASDLLPESSGLKEDDENDGDDEGGAEEEEDEGEILEDVPGKRAFDGGNDSPRSKRRKV